MVVMTEKEQEQCKEAFGLYLCQREADYKGRHREGGVQWGTAKQEKKKQNSNPTRCREEGNKMRNDNATMSNQEHAVKMHQSAIREIMNRRKANGIMSVEKDVLELATDLHVETQINQAALELFYRGELTFSERGGKVYWGLVEKEAA
jgi:DNA phosphorothioation-dependent restriction protein DptG